MNRYRNLQRGLLALGVLLILIGCTGGGGQSTGDANGSGGNTSNDPPTDQPIADSSEFDQIPADVPVMDGAYNLDVVRNATQVNYTVDGDISTVMTFYQEKLPAVGWTTVKGVDSAVGSVGSMTRQNDAKDSLSINMSYNQNGNFVTVLIAISRENP